MVYHIYDLCKDLKYKILPKSVQWFSNCKMRVYLFNNLKKHKICFIVFCNFCLKHFALQEISNKLHSRITQYMQVFMWSVCYCCLILSRIGNGWQIFSKTPQYQISRKSGFKLLRADKQMVSHGITSGHIAAFHCGHIKI